MRKLIILLIAVASACWSIPKPMESITNYNVMMIHGALGSDKGIKEKKSLAEASKDSSFRGDGHIGKYDSENRLTYWLSKNVFEEPDSMRNVHDSYLYSWRSFTNPANSSKNNAVELGDRTYEVLSEKFTNNELYVWLEKELGKTFKKYVNLLIEVAKMAERAYLFEIEGKKEPDYNFIKPSYWDGFRKGLLAPEKILLDLRQMEKAYLENDCHRTIISRPVLLTDDMKTSGETDPFVEYQILDLGSLVSESFVNNKNRKITDVFVQVFSDSGIPPYVCINAEIVLTSSLGSGTCWSSSMAQTREDQIDIHFACDKYLPFEGISLDNSQWKIKVSGQIPSDAKIVMFIKYIAQSAV